MYSNEEILGSLFALLFTLLIGKVLFLAPSDEENGRGRSSGRTTSTPRKAAKSPGPRTPAKGTSTVAKASPSDASHGLWESANPSKRWFENFSIYYSPIWIGLIMGVIVPFKIYEDMGNVGYMMVGLVIFLPTILYPALHPCEADKSIPLLQRHWVRASLWIFIFGHIGNYFWTHYFYRVLGAAYTFESYRLNEVPYCLFLITHAYFLLYHALSNKVLRRVRRATPHFTRAQRILCDAALVFVVSYITAVGETVTIANYPHYNFIDTTAMYKYGTVFYAIYFWVSFPMYIVIEENPGDRIWSLWEITVHSMGAGMIVTWILDAWRLFIGPIVEIPGGCGHGGLPWLK